MFSKELNDFIDDLYDTEDWDEVTLGDKDMRKLKELVKGLRKLELENTFLKSEKGIEELPHWSSTKEKCKEGKRECEVVIENKHLNNLLDVALKDYDEAITRIDKAIQEIEDHNKRTGNLYYKYDKKYLLSEFKQDLLKILKGEE